ncbi:MAG: alpha/beta fold hydrolase [Pseudomonadota bacterium]
MVTVYFATNRNMTGSSKKRGFGKTFNEKGPHVVRLGWAEVEGRSVKIHVAEETLETPDAAKRILGSTEVFGRVMRKMAKHSRDTLVYIHGFGFSFVEALQYAAKLKQHYNGQGPINVFVFSWPGDGKMIPLYSYFSDRSDARNSGMAMARTFLFLRDFINELGRDEQEFCGQRLHLLAHSMGSYALRHGLQGIRHELRDDIPRLFDNVILAAADEDDDTFEHDHKMRKLPSICRRVHVYFSPDDRALLISDKTKGRPDRLGSDGPRLIDDLPRKIALIDCRDVDNSKEDGKSDIQIHQYYRLRPEVIADITDALAGTPPETAPNRKYNPATRSYRLLPAS